jgi:sialate O-acetylesterase
MEMTFKGFGPTTQPILNQPGSEANNPNLRLFTVEKATAPRVQELAKGKWLECTTESAANFSAVAYQFGKMLSDSLKVPVGLIVSSWGGSRVEQWMSKENLQSFPEVKIPEGIDTIKVLDRVPTVLFNAMLVPLVNYGIRGFLWYQGESNRDKPILYANLVPAMVKEWRKVWGKKDLPFYYVQIAPHAYAKDPNKYYGVLIREAQLKSENKIPNSGMVVILDVGSELKIHPPDKTTVSKRLSDIALAKTYGRKGISYFSPTYHSMKIAGDKIVLNFDHAHNGLKSSGTELENFEIAGDDQVFHPAKATILPGGKVEVWSPETPKPVAVRYGFKNWVHGDLFNSEGLPASSFRTDSWDIAPFSFK